MIIKPLRDWSSRRRVAHKYIVSGVPDLLARHTHAPVHMHRYAPIWVTRSHAVHVMHMHEGHAAILQKPWTSETERMQTDLRDAWLPQSMIIFLRHNPYRHAMSKGNATNMADCQA